MGKIFGNDFSEDVEINQTRLDEECRIQAAMYYHYGELLAEARGEQDRAETNLKYVLGAREIAIRANPPSDIKITEAVVTAFISTDSEVVAAREALDNARRKVYTLYAAVNSLEQRKSMLDNLVRKDISASYNSGDNLGNDFRAHMNNRG